LAHLIVKVLLMTATTVSSKPRTLGVAGSLLGLLALAAALLPIWVLPAIMPSKPIEQTVAETGHAIKERIAALKTKTEVTSKTEEKGASASLSQIFSIAAVSLGFLAIACAVLSVLRTEERLPAAMAVALGGGAIAAQFTLLLAGALIGALILYAIINNLDLF
jgi:hypothetical protein